MQILDEQLILSASDLNNFLACAHLTTLDLARARGEVEVEPERGADAELLARKGDEHELRYLESLKAEGREVVRDRPSRRLAGRPASRGRRRPRRRCAPAPR